MECEYFEEDEEEQMGTKRTRLAGSEEVAQDEVENPERGTTGRREAEAAEEQKTGVETEDEDEEVYEYKVEEYVTDQEAGPSTRQRYSAADAVEDVAGNRLGETEIVLPQACKFRSHQIDSAR